MDTFDAVNGATSDPNHAAHVRATRTVLTYTLADVFALVPQEIDWLQTRLAAALEPVAGRASTTTPLSVRQELQDGAFTRALSNVAAGEQYLPVGPQHQALQASPDQWAAVLLDLIQTAYDVPAVMLEPLRVELLNILGQLGVGVAGNPRPSRYLPNDLRHRLHASS